MDTPAQIIENELALQRPEIRRDRAAVLALLAADFVEVDADGTAWDAQGVAEAIASQPGYVMPTVSGMVATPLSPDVHLLTYRDETKAHSSVWIRGDSDRWVLRFHQQTRFPR
ncbi:DUF4440 domain-containing protein [Actinoallomurus acaciae]|uniref:DUF4440 domain-containing protein n=1 Tax=Actinoallomurus acaciae TaxID=502577 RepID=A0ABV5YX93_9ACTN